jgi:hypothetical protein
MTPKEKALAICQAIGVTTLFDMKCNGGHTLPLHVSQKIAHIMVDELIKEQTMWQNGQTEPVKYWQEVKKEVDLI